MENNEKKMVSISALVRDIILAMAVLLISKTMLPSMAGFILRIISLLALLFCTILLVSSLIVKEKALIGAISAVIVITLFILQEIIKFSIKTSMGIAIILVIMVLFHFLYEAYKNIHK